MPVTLAKRPLISIVKPYLTHSEREAALDSLEAAGIISQAYSSYRWDTSLRCSEWVEVREIARALQPQGLGREASAIERADYYVLRANFPTLLAAEYWLEISPSTQVTRELIEALEIMSEGGGLDLEEVEAQRDEILRSAWDSYGWRELRDAASAALNAVQLATDEQIEASDSALEIALDNLGDYDTIADAGVDASESDNGNADFAGLEDLAQTLAAQALATVGIEL